MARKITPQEFQARKAAIQPVFHKLRRPRRNPEGLRPICTDEHYSEAEAADYLDRHIRTLKRWRAKKLHARYINLGGIVYMGEDILRLYICGLDRPEADNENEDD